MVKAIVGSCKPSCQSSDKLNYRKRKKNCIANKQMETVNKQMETVTLGCGFNPPYHRGRKTGRTRRKSNSKVMSALQRPRQKNCKFKGSQGYRTRQAWKGRRKREGQGDGNMRN